MKTKFVILGLAAIFWGCNSVDMQPDLKMDSELSIAEFVEPAPDSIVVNSYEVDRVVSKYLAANNYSPKMSRSASMESISNDKGEACAHVINFGNDQGFMVVSATKQFQPVIAYSDNGSFDIDNLPEGVEVWKDNIVSFISSPETLDPDSIKAFRQMWRQFEKQSFAPNQSRAEGDGHGYIPQADWDYIHSIIKAQHMEWSGLQYEVYTLDELEQVMPERYEQYNDLARSSIWVEYEEGYKDLTLVVFKYTSNVTGGYMLKSRWHQFGNFNQSYQIAYNPEHTLSGPAAAGCGPVALGQIFYYHKYPYNLNWNDMDPYTANKTTSDFLYSIALAANADFGLYATSVNQNGIRNALNTFNYTYSFDNNTSTVRRNASSSLDNKYPVFVATVKTGESVGHAWVLDGYQVYNNHDEVEVWSCRDKRRFEPIYSESTQSSYAFYHVNWGWDEKGTYNGYYKDWTTLIMGSTHDAINGRVSYIYYNIKPN